MDVVACPKGSKLLAPCRKQSNEVGQPHTFTVHVTKSVAGTQSPVVGVKPTVTLTAANGAVVANKVDNCASTGTNASGDCTVTFTSNSTGTVTGHATATVTIGSDDFTVSTDGTAPNSGDAVKTFVDARISIAPDATNEVGASHTFTVTIKQDIGDGNGLVNVPDGTKPTVTLTDANGATHTGPTGTCGGAGTTSGQCTFRVSLCLNNEDSRLPCSPGEATSLTLKGKLARSTGGLAIVNAVQALATGTSTHRGRGLSFSSAFAERNRCTPFSELVVSRGSKKKGKGKLGAVIVTYAAGTDKDKLKLICQRP